MSAISSAMTLRRPRRSSLLRTIAWLRRRSLIGEILTQQLTVAVFVGVLAFAGLWIASSFVVRDQMRAWGAQWLDNLEEVGAPLYLSGNERYRGTERYLDQFAEILFVRYYSASGEPIFTEVADRENLSPMEPLAAAELEALSSRGGSVENHLVETAFVGGPIVRIGKPVFSRAVVADGFLGFDPSTGAIRETLLGYVELGLDFSGQLEYLLRVALTAAAIGAALLILPVMASWRICRRALLPLSALRTPLKQLAQGETAINIRPSGHREIVAIANAINSAASTLHEREQQLADIGSRDHLTGLPSRKAFQKLLAQAVESVDASGASDALLFIDVDRLKYVNHAYGRDVGDGLLRLAADRLRDVARANDVVARFSGDEFVMLLRNVSRKEAGKCCAELIRTMQEGTFQAGSRSLNLRCSIGATMIRGANQTAARLLNRAERACHAAKANGRNQFCFFKASSKEITEATADAGWFQQIQTALKTDGFVLHFQPIVDVHTGETSFHEVLLRMLVDDVVTSPGMFLPAAARLGLMADIDRWVIRRSLQRLALVRAEHDDVRFTLNVSGSTFDGPDFFGELQEELDAAGVPLDAIVIEVTEQIAMRGLETAAAKMAALAKRGCRFAIDDFGSGYCSYSYLKELPIAFVKIHGSFVANLAGDLIDRKIVAGIAEIAAAAGCETIAEHVEDQETFKLLEDLGVAYAQGYYLGKPSDQVKAGVVRCPRSVARRRSTSLRAARYRV